MSNTDMPSTMRAVLLLGHGDVDQLDYRDDVKAPGPEPDEVLIKVGACGMNNTDINTRIGWYSKSVAGATGDSVLTGDGDGSWGGGMSFPRIQGADPAGRIVGVGSKVDPARIGERVICDAWLRDPSGDIEKAGYLGSERDGGFADYVTVPAVNAHAVDTELTDVELASFPCSYATAEHMLERPGVSEGQWVVATGASGGVGGAIVQLARRRGAHTIAIASELKLERTAAATGADHTLARQDPELIDKIRDITGGGTDVLADVVAGEQFPELFEVIRRGGHYTTAGAIAGPIVQLDVRTLYLHDLTMHGCTVLAPAVFANLVRYIEAGEIKPIVAGTYALPDLVEAQRAFIDKSAVGAYVIDMRA
ncbi:MAG: alcohol dehydrogenase family protein [Acidimicrobiia bacterium]|nr:alcohol dehydrogenase family protein [Acidimicrobiia bacterium]